MKVKREQEQSERLQAGLCAMCRYMRQMKSDRGSIFYMCQRSLTDPRFPKYPRLPVLRCLGYEGSEENQGFNH